MSPENFDGIPPFPDDVLTAPLLELSYEKLLNRDATELRRCVSACEDVGFFYLDFRGTESGNSILKQADKLFGIGERLFDLELEEKKKYDYSKKNSYFGYKALGAGIVDKQGNVDKHELYNVAKDHVLGVTDAWPAPKILQDSHELLRGFMTNAHGIVTLVLNLLNDHLQLPPSTLSNLHRLHAVSGDQVRFIKTPPQELDATQVALGQHTDFGSVTVLFNRLGGLQILPPGKDAKWCYVRPLPGRAIINLGDAMVKFTNGLLRSNIHRVVSPPGLQSDYTRYSLVYFSRPEDDVLLKRLPGSEIIPPLPKGAIEEEVKSKDWIIRRALGNRVALHKNIDYEKNMGTEMQSRRIQV